MRLLFNQVATEEFEAGPSELTGVLQHKREDKFTGLVSSFYPSGEQLVFTFYRGKVTNNYLCEPKVVTPLALDGWMAVAVNFGDGLVQVRSLDPSALRLSKLLIETSREPQVEGIESVKIKGLIEQWRLQAIPCIVHMRWTSAEGMVYLSGLGETRDAFITTLDRHYSSLEISLAISRWDGQSCVISRFLEDESIPSHKELHLHYAFIGLTSGLLASYEHFTGEILTASIVRDLLVTAEMSGWMISNGHGKISDEVVFSSPAEAARAYRLLLLVVYRHITAMLGNQVARSITREVFNEKLSEQYQGLVKQYSLIPATIFQ